MSTTLRITCKRNLIVNYILAVNKQVGYVMYHHLRIVFVTVVYCYDVHLIVC